MRLVDIDDLKKSNVAGKTAVIKFLEKYEKDHPVKKIVARDGEWEITMERKTEP